MKYYQNIALALLLSAVLSSVAFAESTTTVKIDPKRMEVKERVKELKEKASSTDENHRDNVCQAMASRIDARLSYFGEKYEQHKTAYDMHREKLLLISAKLEAAGIGTAELNADIALLEGKVAKFEGDHAKVKALLENTKNSSCSDSKEEFKAAVAAVREAQKIVAADARDIFEFIRGTLKADIISLKAEFNAQ